jgi:hypothetical protein
MPLTSTLILIRTTKYANPPVSYARGHYTVGKELVESVLDKVRRVAGKLCTPGVVQTREVVYLDLIDPFYTSPQPQGVVEMAVESAS